MSRRNMLPISQGPLSLNAQNRKKEDGEESKILTEKTKLIVLLPQWTMKKSGFEPTAFSAKAAEARI